MHSDPPFEVKFLVPLDRGDEIIAWSSACLRPDPHADPTIGTGYAVRSLYLDTAQLHVYHRLGSYRRAKYRLRRYGEQPQVFLERKCKTNGQVRKRRTCILDEELAFLAAVERPHDWSGRWFQRRLHARQLLPQLEIGYQRAAFVGSNGESAIRLTVDRHLACHRATELSLANGCWQQAKLLPDQCIVELKFQVVLPATFKRLIQEMSLSAAKVSKYRLGVEACGLLPSANGAAQHA